MNAARMFLLANLDAASTRTYPDEYIERWATVYLAHPALRLEGISFIAFLAQPERWMQYANDQVRERQPSALDLARIRRGLARCGMQGGNGRMFEKLRHHRYPRSRRDFMPEGR